MQLIATEDFDDTLRGITKIMTFFIKRAVQNKKVNKSENCLAPNSAKSVVILPVI